MTAGGPPAPAFGRRPIGIVVGACLAAWAGLWAGPVAIPNGSFESPRTDFVDTRVDSWQKSPKPAWWDEQAYGPWDQLVGVFANVPPEDPRHIDNCDGQQAIWVFANPEVGLFQELAARFEVGRAYELTVGLFVGPAYPMAPGATLELNLYYRDAASNRVVVAATVVTNTASVLSNVAHHLVDFHVVVPPVRASAAWAGQPIGVAILSTVSEPAGGYWVLDNVRLTETQAPVFREARLAGGSVSFRLEGEPGQRLEVLASPDLLRPLSEWVSVGTLTNQTGSVWFTDPATNGLQRFYRVRHLP